MKKSISFALVLSIVSLFTAATAFADETTPEEAAKKKPAKAAVEQKTNEKGYGYEFKDDPLNAGVDGTKGFVITVRPKAMKTQLLRPRASFVQEMLKSVEAI